MKTLEARLAAHLAGTSTSLALVWKITRRDAAVKAFTTHDKDITLSGVTYKSTGGIAPTSISWQAGVRADSTELVGLYDASGITEADLDCGLYDAAAVELRLVSWEDPAGGSILLPCSGYIDSISMGELGYRITAVSKLAKLEQRTLPLYSPTCRVDLGGTQCGVDLETGQLDASHKYKYTGCKVTSVANSASFGVDVVVTPETVAGTSLVAIADATTIGANHMTDPPRDYFYSDTLDLTAEGIKAGMTVTVAGFSDARDNGDWTVTKVEGGYAARHYYRVWVVSATAGKTRLYDEAPGSDIDITEKSGTQASYTPSGWFAHGTILWTSGLNTGLSMEVREYDATAQTVKLVLPMRYAVALDDTFTIYAGCDKRRGTCKTKFSNLVNFRGEPDLPGRDELGATPGHASVEVD